MIILLSVRVTFTMTSMAWTKTAFAVTLLRLTAGWTRSFVWFIIISLNVTTIVSASIPWIRCKPLAKTWDRALPGTCWAPMVGTKIYISMGGWFRFLPPPHTIISAASSKCYHLLTLGFSIFRAYGLHPGRSAMDISLSHSPEEKGDAGSTHRDEHGCSVSIVL